MTAAVLVLTAITQVLAAALAAMSGFRSVPQPRSLLTSETGMVTLRLLAKRGQVDGFTSLLKALRTVGACNCISCCELPAVCQRVPLVICMLCMSWFCLLVVSEW